MTLTEFKTELAKAESRFDELAKRDYVDGRWGYYRAIECDWPVKPDLQAAFDDYHNATRDYYMTRDGERGFLGARGL